MGSRKKLQKRLRYFVMKDKICFSAHEQNKLLFDEVRALKLPQGQFALFGSAPIGVRGLKMCNDIDVIVNSAFFESCKKSGAWTIKIFEKDGSEYLSRGNVELWDEWGPGNWDIDTLIAAAEIIDGLPFVTLENVVRWKTINGREKDLKDIALIADFLSEK